MSKQREFWPLEPALVDQPIDHLLVLLPSCSTQPGFFLVGFVEPKYGLVQDQTCRLRSCDGLGLTVMVLSGDWAIEDINQSTCERRVDAGRYRMILASRIKANKDLFPPEQDHDPILSFQPERLR